MASDPPLADPFYADVDSLNIFRSGSAPPTVDGARAAAALRSPGSLITEDDIRSHPDYLSYYYSNENLNPRMPPPALTREDWRSAQRLQQPIGRREGREGSSLFSVQPGAERDAIRRKSFADTLKERPVSTPGSILSDVLRDSELGDGDDIYHGGGSNGLARVQSFGSFVGRSTTPDPQLGRRSPSIRAVGGRISDVETLSNGFVGRAGVDCTALTNGLSGLKLTEKIAEDEQNFRRQSFADQPDLLFNMSRDKNVYMQRSSINEAQSDSSVSTPYNDFAQRMSTPHDVGQINQPKQLTSGDAYRMVDLASTGLSRPTGHYQTDRQRMDFAGSYTNAFSGNLGMTSTMNNQLDQGTSLAVGAEGRRFNEQRTHVGSGTQVSINDPLYAQYLLRGSDSAAQVPAVLNDPSLGRNYLGNSLMNLHGYQEAYLGALLAQQNPHFNSPFFGKSASFNNGLYENPPFGFGLPYQNHSSDPRYSSLGPVSPLRQNEHISRLPSMTRGATAGSKGSWSNEKSVTEGGFASSLLEELKNNKTRSFELPEIVGHVLEFSGDQYGSRFIQQKLESGSIEEKNSIFPEILSRARVLMTDVFGNYVIQKFFEHGTQSQRNQLADQLIGHVLPLSLQMYGCRVIQKALEVVDVNQQTQMVKELDGSVMKCVRDQNGNHVIQKCIECVPQERIHFIISSFFGQVVALSTHPYGCRVIQRVLEHCDDAQTQSMMMEEIMQSVCTLAQDQYGNYVVQHVVQHGKPEERSAIVKKFGGQIVKMSQQKFASNVVEKCLTYGTPEERMLLIDEMVGTPDENEPLQAMMKDQFGNYVVQKVLETCDDQKLELIISRIKVHLNALKKYTYGKHIVARVEKLIATGERRIGLSAISA